MIRMALIICFILAGGYAAYFLFAPASIRYSSEIRRGNRIAREIDRFRARKGHLPLSLTEIGKLESESGPFYYERCGESRYIVWFGTTLGESMTYDSAKRVWTSLNLTCPATN